LIGATLQVLRLRKQRRLALAGAIPA